VPGAIILKRYRLQELVAKTGSATRWTAIDETLTRPVFVVALPIDNSTNNYLESGRLASAVMDSHFLRILDVDKDADGGFVVCERVDGFTLSEILASGPLSGEQAAWVVREVATGLAAAHEVQQYHCRIDPTKVYLTTGGHVNISGLGVDLALTPRQSDRKLSRTHMESMDVVGCGGLLYACLTATWPGSAEVGLPPAPRNDTGLSLPGQVRPGTPVALDRLTAQILSLKDPDHPTTTQGVVQRLTTVLGAKDPTSTLIDRITQAAPVRPREVTAQEGPAVKPRILGVDPEPTPAPPAPPEDSRRWASEESVTMAIDPSEQETEETPEVDLPDTTGDKPRATPLRAPIPPDKARTWSRVFVILVSLIVLGLISSLVVGLYHAARDPKPAASPTVSDLTTYEIVGAVDFDPKEDGGNGWEHPDEAPYAFDKDPTTKWTTETYDQQELNYSGNYIPEKKPGVGLVFDLGEPVEVSQVTITIDLRPITVVVYIPEGDASTVSEPNMNSILHWTPVATTELTEEVTSIDIDPVTTRYVIVYITQLVTVGEGRTQADLVDVTFAG
jgi:putative peptidoglycan lipid II flippase